MLPHPLLCLLTYRSDEVHPSLSQFLAQLDRERLAQEFSLTPLSRSEVSAMLYAIFVCVARYSVPPLAQATCWMPIRLTEGNPFFVEELLKSLIERRRHFLLRWSLGAQGPLAELRIPRSVQDAVERRTDHLSEGARQRSDPGSGGRTALRFCPPASSHPTRRSAAPAAHQGVDRGPTRRRGVGGAVCIPARTDAASRLCATAGPRAQDVASHDCRDHRASLRLDIEAHLADLAFHFFEAGVWEKALEYGQRAGEQAQALYAPQAAIEHFTRALDAARQLSLTPPVSLYRARGLAYETLGDFERARADHETALQLAHQAADRHAEWQALIDLGFLWAGRDYAQAGDYYQQALALARTMDDPATVAHSLNRLGNWYLNAEQPHEALRCHQEALATFQDCTIGMARPTLDLLGMASY